MGGAIHDKALDSNFEEERLIATLGASQDITENIEVFIEHNSQPMYRGDDAGVNKAGIKLKAKIF